MSMVLFYSCYVHTHTHLNFHSGDYDYDDGDCERWTGWAASLPSAFLFTFELVREEAEEDLLRPVNVTHHSVVTLYRLRPSSYGSVRWETF